MRKIVIASHGKLAAGMKSTLDLFIPKETNITYMSAYVDDIPSIEDQIEGFIENIQKNDEIIVFTDLYGGSVNQKFLEISQDFENFYIVAGFNVPVIIELIYSTEKMTFQTINKIIEKSRSAMCLANANDFSDNSLVESTEVNRQGEQSIEKDNFSNKSIVLRVDERLIHGQIAMVWSRELSLHGIIVANDEAATNETQQMALKMAVPDGIRVLIRSVEGVVKVLKDKRANTKNLLVIVRTVQDALRLVQSVDNIDYVNIGNVGKSVEGKKTTLTQFVMLTDPEMVALSTLVKVHPNTCLQNLPSDEKIKAEKYLK
ncbi:MULTISPECIES: PTS mannose/fructose/sorbose transporter subunit IIAB [Aerococcus]|uniref:PTS mannose/fructose/sorbose transporter subunit IIAB n=1 Tax=Aerococcus urinae (strain CCUG 59500 / ACS-120-V-Col10a) TaxID=2976812 RepID=UPI000200FD4F|nr:PTS mannose/fructose/sorbose transporter subunit IIAB [Aerococcus sp. Group 1]AEA01216.1 PTS system fructose IIA component [Aerococcus sp. Group 1]MCY3031163.1 PTS mannose/fructose/sorbose transporter subunit IIAB [Aerococcus sp. Group 1]MCY3054200.1 PTS mannose/fructose/sorbose transporter subunit IIAB [Aerococcus sp. Group 1]MCY3055930.1 PTS mannose/fructose/sorbose transporter subunit IIAB [Aerococcus sp. Group 1]MCY3061922.1 PTS mannose/fructose/sorbose transporter subunit IIAB [Aerococ